MFGYVVVHIYIYIEREREDEGIVYASLTHMQLQYIELVLAA